MARLTNGSARTKLQNLIKEAQEDPLGPLDSAVVEHRNKAMGKDIAVPGGRYPGPAGKAYGGNSGVSLMQKVRARLVADPQKIDAIIDAWFEMITVDHQWPPLREMLDRLDPKGVETIEEIASAIRQVRVRRTIDVQGDVRSIKSAPPSTSKDE